MALIARRQILFGLIAAPLIVRSGILMPVRPLVIPPPVVLLPRIEILPSTVTVPNLGWHVTYDPIDGTVDVEPIDDSGWYREALHAVR